MDSTSRRRGIAAAVALVVAAFVFAGYALAELGAGDRRGDGDNPADSVAFLVGDPRFFAVTGALLFLGGVALVVGIVAFLRAAPPTLPASVLAALGGLGGGLFVLSGVMRLQASGTLLHIAGLDADWGESAYLVVQMAGTQGASSAGILLLALWVVGTAVRAAARGVPGLLVAAVPAAFVLGVLSIDVLLPMVPLADVVFPVYVVAILFGLPLGCVAIGAALLIPGSSARMVEAE